MQVRMRMSLKSFFHIFFICFLGLCYGFINGRISVGNNIDASSLVFFKWNNSVMCASRNNLWFPNKKYSLSKCYVENPLMCLKKKKALGENFDKHFKLQGVSNNWMWWARGEFTKNSKTLDIRCLHGKWTGTFIALSCSSWAHLPIYNKLYLLKNNESPLWHF